MKPFTNFSSRMAPLAINNIDTDQIIPARFLKTTTKQGLDQQLFCDWRYDAEGHPNPDFILNQPRARGAQVLLAGDNFGCGSSREHAPWALTQFGFSRRGEHVFCRHLQTELVEEFAAAHRGAPDVQAELFAAAAENPDAVVKVDLVNQTLTTPGGRKVEFPIDGFSKRCLVEGVDELGYILQHEAQIAAYEARRVGSIDTRA